MTFERRLVLMEPAELERLIESSVESTVRRLLSSRADAPVDWIDAGAAAKLLGVNRRTIAKLAKRGDLPSSRLGRLLRFRRADVLGLLEKRGGG